jgi:type I site-specific restriction endonuclease
MEVLCPVRKRWVKLEPEEWVRQHWLHYLADQSPEGLGYPIGSIGVEVALELNGTKRRADAICHDATGKPVVLLEFKAPSISVTQATLDQAVRYNLVLDLPYLILSNGLQHFVYSTPSNGQPVSLSAVPALFSRRNTHS